MQYPSKKLSWLDFINQSMDNRIKSEALDRPINGVNHNYYHHPHHHSMTHPNLVQTSSFDRSNYKQQQQQNDLENRKYKNMV